VYASESLALAALEYLVNVDPTTAPNDLRAIPADVPEDVPTKTLSADVLPKNWRSFPAPPELALLGANWAESLETAVLRVPSAVVPQESNFLLNPRHPAFARIAVLPAIPFELDVRIWRKKAPGR
jgi:RES domain-containing protein